MLDIPYRLIYQPKIFIIEQENTQDEPTFFLSQVNIIYHVAWIC